VVALVAGAGEDGAHENVGYAAAESLFCAESEEERGFYHAGGETAAAWQT